MKKKLPAAVQKLREDYFEKLRDPRWQKRRLQILDRDGWACRHCGDEESTLHVHHTHYVPNAEPWDHPDECLMTLCAECHQEESENRKEVEQILLYTLRTSGFGFAEVHELACCLDLWNFVALRDEDEFNAVTWAIQTPHIRQKLVKEFKNHLTAGAKLRRQRDKT